MQIYERLRIWSEWTSLRVDSPVRMFPGPDRGRSESTAQDPGYGPNTPESFACLDREACSWRTSQVCLTGELAEFSGTWPRAGTMRSGIVFQQPPLVLPTYEIEFSYLPTPDASLGGFGKAVARMDTTSWWNKETTGKRPSGASIGSSLRWCREFIQEHLRTGGELNPQWPEVLMGFPIDWTALSAAETPSSPRSPSGSDAE